MLAILYQATKNNRSRIPVAERPCEHCGAVFILSREKQAKKQACCSWGCANKRNARRRPLTQRRLSMAAIAAISAKKARSKAGAFYVMQHLGVLDNALDPETRERVKRALAALYLKSYSIGYRAGWLRAAKRAEPRVA